MDNKLKKLLSCVALLCAFGMLVGCNKDNDSESAENSSTVESSVSEESSSIAGSSSSIEDSASVEDGSSIEDSASAEDSSVEDSSSEDSSVPEVTTYTVTWVNEDGTVLETDTGVAENTIPTYDGATPEKASDEQYTYTFAGWNAEVVAVTGNVTYTATYTSTHIEYTVVYLNDDGTILSRQTYHYGEDVSVPVAEKADSAVYSYTFDGWENVSESAPYTTTYKAKYTATLKDGYNVNNTEASVGESVVLGAGSIGGGANYTKGQQNDDGDDTPSYVRQAYLAFDGNYNLDDYVVFDFTGKNMPEIAFFANNYNESMYAEGTDKQGILVYSGITVWDGSDIATLTNDKTNGTYINYGFPYMLQDAASGAFCQGAFADSALGRANLVDGTQYRVIMGFVAGSAHGANGITLQWALYNRADNTLVEEGSLGTWNFFTGTNAQVGNKTLSDLNGSIVLYGKFGVATTLDKVWGVYQDTDIASIANGINNNATYTVTFKDADGNVLQTVENVAFGEIVSYTGGDSEAFNPPADDALFTYSYAWDKAFGPISADTEYQLTLISTPKDGVNANNVTAQGAGVVLGSGAIGDGANYTKGQNNGGYVNQAYLGFDGGYGLDNYIVFDFTGKNLPEIAFFANNYNNSMYAEGTDKQGIVVVTGITTWNGGLDSGVNGNGTQINYGHPYMIQDAASGAFCQSAMKSSALGRANLVDGTHYRVIMGFTGSGSAITLNWCLYNLDTNEVVEQSSMTTWNFFTGSNSDVGNMTINDLNGSIVLYGKFGTTCTIDALHGVKSGAFADIVAEYTAEAN